MQQAELIDSKEKLKELEEAASEGLARAQTAGEGNQGPVRQHCRQLPAQRNGLFSGMCDIFSHTMLLHLEA